MEHLKEEAMRRAYLKSVGLRWLGGLTTVIGVGSLELIQYAANSQPFGQAVVNNSPLLILFAGLLAASVLVLIRGQWLLGWISYLVGMAAGPLILWGLGSYLEGPSLAWVSLSAAVVVGFTPLPGSGTVDERRAGDDPSHNLIAT